MAPALLLLAPAPLAAAAPAIVAVQAAAGLPPLTAGAIRFTAIQPGGRGATIYQAERGPNGLIRTLIDLAPVPGGGWSVDARETKPVAAETLAYFSGLIDAAAARGGEATACPAGGPEYLAEHGAASASGCGADGDVPAIARGLGLAEPVEP